MVVWLTYTVVLLVVRVIYEYAVRDRKLPPGPPRLPLIGNVHQAPREHAWKTYRAWSKQYGPIMSAQFGPNTVIIITDAQIARDLLDKRGKIYSDRPRMVMVSENLTKGLHLLLRRYDDRYRLHQRMEAPFLSPRASQAYVPIQDLESKQLLHEFLTSNDFSKHFSRFSATLVYSLAYGKRLVTGEEPILHQAHQVNLNFAESARIGNWTVDVMPFLNRLPECIAPWKRIGNDYFMQESALHLQNFRDGLNSPAWNWTKEFVQSKEAKTMSDLEIAYNLGILADAGVDTTWTQMQIFILAMVRYPDVVRKAQEEIDRVVGSARLPDIDDKPNLPYLLALLEETLRWRSLTPMGIPHAVMEDDEYGGYRIPKGATVLALPACMGHDEQNFDDPLEFRPERWLEKGDGRFTNFFGYGRRICTGRHIARNSLFLLMSRILWAFHIHPAQDEHGNEKEIDDQAFTSGFISRPCSFQVEFHPRSAQHRDIIEREWDAAEKDINILLKAIDEHQQRVRHDQSGAAS
ncbi:cytochrome P450 [Aspergillus floccosus]